MQRVSDQRVRTVSTGTGRFGRPVASERARRPEAVRPAVELVEPRTDVPDRDLVFPMWCEQARDYAVVISDGLPELERVVPVTGVRCAPGVRWR